MPFRNVKSMPPLIVFEKSFQACCANRPALKACDPVMYDIDARSTHECAVCGPYDPVGPRFNARERYRYPVDCSRTAMSSGETPGCSRLSSVTYTGPPPASMRSLLVAGYVQLTCPR